MGSLFLKSCGTCITMAALALPAAATEDTDTPGPGRWENNLGLSVERHHGNWRVALPDAEINYGLGEQLQLLLGMPYVRVRDADGARSSGFGNITAGAKWRFFDDEARGTALAFFPRLSWNASSATASRGLETRGYSFLVPLVAGFRQGDTGWYAEVGRNFVQEGPHEWQAGLKVLHQCLPQLECRVELEHRRVPRDGGQTTARVGGKWRLQEGLILNVSAGKDVAGAKEGRRSLVAYVGLQFLR
jgi:hypothetical protein